MPRKPGRSTPNMQRILQVFTNGFAYGRSLTHPYLAERVGKLWVTRDAPRKNPTLYRREEWFAYNLEPKAVDKTARQHTRGRWAICAVRDVNQNDAELRAAYKSLGYRLGNTEPIFVHHLKQIPKANREVLIEPVQTAAVAEQLAKTAGRRQIGLDELRAESTVRQYVARDGGNIVGWVKSVGVGNLTWCANLFVKPTHRRRGIARALMTTMLRDDLKHGATANVLASSHAGAMLYPTLGYQQVGLLLLFTPAAK